MNVIKSGDGRVVEIPEGGLKSYVPPDDYRLTEDRVGFNDWYNRRQAATRQFNIPGMRPGQSRGKSLEDCLASRDKAAKLAKRIVKKLVEPLNLDEKAREALEETITIMKDTNVPKNLKLAAAKQVLEFTMAKPVAKQEVTVNSAESWLKSLTPPKAE